MLSRLLSGYASVEGRYDELLSAPGIPRPHWDAFLRSLAARQGLEVSETLALMESEIRENGITYNVYADPKGADRPWEVDPLPLLLSATEWDEIAAGIAQRADLLNRVLGDIYGPQELLRSGAIPPSIIFGHSGYLHQVQGIRPPGGVHLFNYAADLARSPDGHWWVVNDRTQAPSGSGYALENRLVVSRVFPQMFRDLHVQHLASFFDALRESLLRWAPKDVVDRASERANPLVVLLTPGPYNETYFEHALLARYLGFPLVEGSDLTVRDGCVWMKTVEGLKRVNAILRRQDDDYCDPLELRSDSALGVPGLTDCARRGTVLLANALGSGVLESGGLLGYLPKLSEQLLGEPLRLPSVATWWLGEPAALDDAWSRLDKLIIKPLERSIREPAVFGADLSAKERAALRERVAARPQRYVAQEWVHVSQAPVIEQGSDRQRAEQLGSRTVGLRVFAVATPSGYHVMPGGLTRVAGDDQSRVIAMQRGGRSKDTWVLSDAPVNASFSLLSRTVKPQDLVASRANVPSRAAENLFWFGRYGERCESAARLLRVAIGDVLDDSRESADGVAPTLILAQRFGLIDNTDNPSTDLLRAATHPDEGLSERLRQLSRVAFNLRDRMSADHWRSLNQLISDPVFQRGLSSTSLGLPLAMGWLDRAVTSMMTLSGFVLDGMTRGVGWRFLSIGRRIERLSTLCNVLQVAINEGRSHGLDWLLEYGDSTVTYRSRYLVAPEWLPVLDLLLRDEVNPRSIAFQVKGLAEYVAKLELSHGRFASDVLAPAHNALRNLDTLDLNPESEALADVLVQLQRAAHAVSDELTLKFFSHAASRSVLSLVA
ncbi:MAG: circularly permuted type 2 ATP-grasp protein [Rhizobacter sp.]|nr:circularly permuted type 2 ATP-grasp protein [Rhizobacter sp.]MBP6270414.1 circularly permuted type 2 ATP-grasp protein [Rhizobacter sp.]